MFLDTIRSLTVNLFVPLEKLRIFVSFFFINAFHMLHFDTNLFQSHSPSSEIPTPFSEFTGQRTSLLKVLKFED